MEFDELELDTLKNLVKMALLENKETLKYVKDKEEVEVLEQDIRILEGLVKKLK